MSPKHRDELQRIQDALAESLNQASDKEVLEDAKAAGLDPQAESQQFTSILAKAKITAGKRRLELAKTAARGDQRQQLPNISIDMSRARAQLKQLVANDPSFSGGLMLAARNAGPGGIDSLSDADVAAMLEMAIELGRIPPDGQ